MELTLIYTIIGFGLAGWSVIANDSVQIFGGYGYIKDFPVEKFLRDS